ncbi:hypothetical protein JC221_201 [Yersinia phage JC221]|nr:hypothetical protein JC221_201 [Yersinia phage JC221]
MKYYDPKTLTDVQKKELVELAAKTSKNVIKLHEWILGYDECELIYVKPKDRKYYNDAGEFLKNNRPVEVIQIWKLLDMMDPDLPVDGPQFILYLNNIADYLDHMYKVVE